MKQWNPSTINTGTLNTSSTEGTSLITKRQEKSVTHSFLLFKDGKGNTGKICFSDKKDRMKRRNGSDCKSYSSTVSACSNQRSLSLKLFQTSTNYLQQTYVNIQSLLESKEMGKVLKIHQILKPLRQTSLLVFNLLKQKNKRACSLRMDHSLHTTEEIGWWTTKISMGFIITN